MNGISVLVYMLAVAIWMQARITSSSSGIPTSRVTNGATATTKLTYVSTGSATLTSVAVTASFYRVMTGSVTLTRTAVPASLNVTAPDTVNSTIVAVFATSNVTISSAASKSVSMSASTIVTTSSKASISVAVQSNTTNRSVVSTSVAVQSNAASRSLVTTSVVGARSNLTSTLTAAVQTHSTTSSVISSLTSSMSSLHPSANSTASVNGTASPGPTPAINSSVYSTKTSQLSQQVSPVSSSLTSFKNMSESSSSAAVLATSFTSQSTSTLLVAGQTSNTSRLPSLDATMHSPSVSPSTQVDTSIFAQSSSKEMVSAMTQHLVGSLTVSVSNSSSTSSPPINATSTSPDIIPSTSVPPSTSTPRPPPTLPPEGTKFVSMEVSFEMEFKKEYGDTSSPEYEELENNLTTTLTKVYEDVNGFVAVRILFITEGSVVCSYIVILTKNSKVEESELEDKLDQASKKTTFPFKVKSINVAEDKAEKTEEKLPKWALAIMIVLGCLSAVFLITVIYVCVKYRRTLYGSRDAYLVSTGEIGVLHTYDTVSMGDNKMPTSQRQKATPERRVIGSHTNPTYGANGALAD